MPSNCEGAVAFPIHKLQTPCAGPQALEVPAHSTPNSPNNRSDKSDIAGYVHELDYGRSAMSLEKNGWDNDCEDGALALCPGHGSHTVDCVFVHLNGQVKLCLMVVYQVPECTHSTCHFQFRTILRLRIVRPFML